MKTIKKNGGFTLVELIVVIAILAILAGIAIPAYSGYIDSANEAKDNTQLAAIKTAAMAACATEGAVNTITVTTDNSTGAVTKVEVNYGSPATTVDVTPDPNNESTKIDDNFDEFYIGTLPTLVSDEFKGGAVWSSTGDSAGEWVKK